MMDYIFKITIAIICNTNSVFFYKYTLKKVEAKSDFFLDKKSNVHSTQALSPNLIFVFNTFYAKVIYGIC